MKHSILRYFRESCGEVARRINLLGTSMNMPGRSYEPVHFTLFTICSALNTNSSKPRGCLYDYGHRLTLYILHYNEAKPSARSILLPSRLALIFSSSRLAPHKKPLHAVVEYDARGEAGDDSLKADSR